MQVCETPSWQHKPPVAHDTRAARVLDCLCCVCCAASARLVPVSRPRANARCNMGSDMPPCRTRPSRTADHGNTGCPSTAGGCESWGRGVPFLERVHGAPEHADG